MKAQNVVSPWTCQFCKQAFYNDAVPIIGIDPAAQNAPFITKLMEHLKEKHAEALHQAALAGQQYTTVILLSCFQTTEDTGQDRLRWDIHNKTRRATIDDTRIEERVQETINGILQDATGINPTSKSNLDLVKMRFVALLKQMRDISEERGRYPV